jgi:hypothetical protein
MSFFYHALVYLAAIGMLALLGAIGALLFGGSYLLLCDVRRWLLQRWRRPAKEDSEIATVDRPRRFILRGICLLAILAAWWLQIPELHERGTLTLAESMRRPWGFTADGQYLAYLDAQGKLSLFDVQTAHLAATHRLRTDPPTRVMGGNTDPELARQMWFLPGGRELLLDCWPFGFITIDTATWSEITPRFAGNRPLGPSRDEMRGNSASGRIMVTSPEHRAYELQNDTTLTIWDMVRHAPVRQVTIRPQQNLWIGDDTVWINEAANVLVLGVRRGTRPGGGTEVWNLDTGARTPLKIMNEGKLDPQGKRIAHFHYSLDLETGQQQPILARANVIDFTPNGRSLLAMHGESQNSKLPVLGSLISSAFDHRLLVYDAAGRRILGKSPNLSQTFPAVGSDVKIAPDGRHVAVRAPDAKPMTIRIFCLPR